MAVSSLQTIETELKKRIAEHPFTPWGRKQSNEWDYATNFIYSTSTWEELKDKIQKLQPDLQNYAINRWFNFWSARGVETIFCQQANVVPNKNTKDKLVDFTIQNIQFDHKTTVYPKSFPVPLPLKTFLDKGSFIQWLYSNQSTENRYHCSNRLFIVLYAASGEHWKLKAELSQLEKTIHLYIQDFNPKNLCFLTLNNQKITSDLIWFIN